MKVNHSVYVCFGSCAAWAMNTTQDKTMYFNGAAVERAKFHDVMDILTTVAESCSKDLRNIHEVDYRSIINALVKVREKTGSSEFPTKVIQATIDYYAELAGKL